MGVFFRQKETPGMRFFNMLAEQLRDEQPQAIEVVDTSYLGKAANSPIVVVGSGPVGMRFVKHVLDKHPDTQINLFGNEPFAPYNRVQLSSLLAGDVKREQINIPLPSDRDHPNFSFEIANISAIDRDNKLVIDTLGNSHPYATLILATGARAYVPNIPGNKQQGVYRFRNLADAESLFARVTRCRHVVVLGGGLLGLEAAKALCRAGTIVTVIQQGTHLMNRQLDDHAAALLQAEVENLGIKVITQSGVREILGEGRVSGVRTNNGNVIDCDTVLICAGIQPNIEIALNAKLSVGQGIVVNDFLQTSDPDIFAIGECCEHQGRTYGLVNPGFEQAAIAADVVCKGKANYKGSQSVSRLKVVGQQVCSMGEVVDLAKHPFQHEITYQDKKTNTYRKLVLLKGKLLGAVAYGEWPEANRIQTVFQNRVTIWPWQRWLFQLTGRLWIQTDSGDVTQWPASATVCQCNNITKGSLNSQIDLGCNNLSELQNKTNAGTVCGSCKPLLSELLGSSEKPAKESAWSLLIVCSVLAVVGIGLQIFMPEANVADSVQTEQWFQHIWNDKFAKQVTGFTLLGLTLVGLFMSLRKHFNFTWMGKFAYWRAAHTVLGVLCAIGIIFHTGFHLGSNLNQILMINFLTVLVLGSSAGLVVGLSHTLKPALGRKLRKTWTWLHVLVSWPLPALLSAHILSVYYF